MLIWTVLLPVDTFSAIPDVLPNVVEVADNAPSCVTLNGAEAFAPVVEPAYILIVPVPSK